MRAQIVIKFQWLLAVVSGLLFLSATAQEQPYQVTRDVYYGSTPEARDREYQLLDVYWQDKTKRRPVIIYVHGGGWAFGDKSDVHHKPGFFVPQGYAFISMNYRLRWDFKVYHQLEDIVSVVNWVHRNAGAYGLDPSRVILMGNEAGAHLISLVGTDSRYLRGGDLTLKNIRGVVAMDTISFDIPAIMAAPGRLVEKKHHRVIFGELSSVWKEISPITHIESDPDMPAFALMYSAQDEFETGQVSAFAKRLTRQGIGTIMVPVHVDTVTIDEQLGSEGDLPTQAVMAFIRART